jgi:hypothetical protein
MFRGARGKKQGRKTMYGNRNQKNFDNGRGGISSDDPNALEKLQKKLQEQELLQQAMKDVNAIIRREKTTEGRIKALVALGHEPGLAPRLLEPDYAGRIGFKEYQLTNNSANIRRIRDRRPDIG